MARQLRIEYENAYYHITVRGNEKRKIFKDDFDREMFLNVVGEAYDRFNFLIHAFVLMDNHYHFLMETPQANLSSSMRQINQVYTQAFNKKHKRVGHLFQGRFKAIVVEKDAYYLELIRYIHLNPLRAGILENLEDFLYSGHRAIIDDIWAKKIDKWYDRNLILREFGNRQADAIAGYKNYVNAGIGKESPLKKVMGGYALGKESFANWLWSEFIDKWKSNDIVVARELAPKIGPEILISEVAREFGVKRGEIFKSYRRKEGENIIRGIALHLLFHNTGLTQEEIGRMTGLMSATAVSKAIRRFNDLLIDNDKLMRVYNRILSKTK